MNVRAQCKSAKHRKPKIFVENKQFNTFFAPSSAQLSLGRVHRKFADISPACEWELHLPTKNRVKQLLERGVEKSESHTKRKQLGIGFKHTLPHLTVHSHSHQNAIHTEEKKEKYICWWLNTNRTSGKGWEKEKVSRDKKCFQHARFKRYNAKWKSCCN